jgi:hypothetical protein
VVVEAVDPAERAAMGALAAMAPMEAQAEEAATAQRRAFSPPIPRAQAVPAAMQECLLAAKKEERGAMPERVERETMEATEAARSAEESRSSAEL